MSTQEIGRRREPRILPEIVAKVAVVIPARDVASWIVEVLDGIPAWIRLIIVIDDGSRDETGRVVAAYAEQDSRVKVLRHEQSEGLTAAMVLGIRAALDQDVEIVVKMDGDGQMDPRFLPELLQPILLGEADYTKGNRFQYSGSLSEMPWLRQAGNLALSFLVKGAVGYWDIFDPTNGYLAIRSSVLRRVDLDSIRGYYFFETALLAELYLLRAVVKDIPMPAIYRGEPSHMRIGRVLCEYPVRLLRLASRRLWIRYFLLDFSIVSLYLLAGLLLLGGGAVYGGINWWIFAQSGVGAPTGTVVISAMLIILGIQLLLAAIAGDLQSVPREPLEPSAVAGAEQLTRLWETEPGDKSNETRTGGANS